MPTGRALQSSVARVGCWLLALRLLADVWESTESCRSELVLSVLSACSVAGEWQLAMSLAFGALEADCPREAYRHILRACTEARCHELLRETRKVVAKKLRS